MLIMVAGVSCHVYQALQAGALLLFYGSAEKMENAVYLDSIPSLTRLIY